MRQIRTHAPVTRDFTVLTVREVNIAIYSLNRLMILLNLFFFCKGGPGTTQVTSPITTNVCQSRVCYNGGSCFINKENMARCQCKRGYIGLNCETDICLQKQVVGTCRQHVTRYWYDASRLSCQPFTFSGCNGK